MQNTPYCAFTVPRPSPSFPSLAVRSPASVACSKLASFPSLAVRLRKQREAGQGPGKEAE